MLSSFRSILSSLVLVVVAFAAANSAIAQSNAANDGSRAYLNNNNIPSTGLALEGYCPVAYFAVNKPVMGKPEFASTQDGVTYHFVNSDAKAEFDRNPEKYVPAYGGWCAFGMAIGDKFPIDPTNFKIVDGRLNVFLRNKNVDARQLWNDGNEQEYVSKAASHWKKVNQ